MFGGDGELVSVDQIPYYAIHYDTPLFLQSVVCERIVHCFRPTTAYPRRLAAFRSAIAINVVRFLETFLTGFLLEQLGSDHQRRWTAAAVLEETTKRREIGDLVLQSSKHPAQARVVR